MKKLLKVNQLLLAWYLLAGNALAAQQPFHYDSLDRIEEDYTGQAFLLVVWSLECPPCRAELELLAKLKQQGREFNLVLVSTDDINQAQSLDDILGKYQLQQMDSWAFASDNKEKLRFHLDPEWFGEMPRSYFYDAQHQRIAISGKLTRQIIDGWLNDQR